jgi:uncharacterized protein (TIGR03437 family)
MGKHTYRLLRLILILAGLMIWLILRPDSAGRTSAQATRPSWSVTGSLNTRRGYHTATLLHNGKVLVAGGYQYEGARTLDSVELYDPSTGKWSETGSLNKPRAGHKATLLADGKVLITGGEHDLARGGLNNSAELYDPISGTWSVTGNLNTEYLETHNPVLLPNGNVFIRISDALEIYNPATGRWKYEHLRLPRLRLGHTTTLLTDGRVLVAGGGDFKDYGDEFVIDGSVEVYDQITGFRSHTGNLVTPRTGHTATLLSNGQVLVVGGVGSDAKIVRSAELYDPVTGTWSVADSLNLPPDSYDPQTATLLSDGKVLFTGFTNDDDDGYFARTYLYHSATRNWSDGGNLIAGRFGHTATLLPNGRVLIVGGYTVTTTHNSADLNSAELFDPGLPQPGTIANVSAASFSLMGLAGEAIAAAFGDGLATTVVIGKSFPLPTELAGTSVSIKDSTGNERFAPLFFVSPSQVNYLIPEGTAAGAAMVRITSGDGRVSTGTAIIRAVAPSLFTANSTGEGLAAALALRVKADGTQSYEPVAQLDEELNRFVARPIDLGPEGERVYLVLFGTGIRHRRALSSVIAAIGGEYAEVTFAGAHDEYVGVDQVNLLLPRSLSGRGEVEVLLTVEAQMANPVRLQIK